MRSMQVYVLNYKATLPVLGAGDNGWGEQLKEEMMERFGSTLHVTMVFESDSPSVDFIEGDTYKDAVAFQPPSV
jgi:hypothetical protein